jgi:hypothetical protein
VTERGVVDKGLGDHRERFVETRIGLCHIDAEASEFVVAIALADAEIEPAAGQQVQGRGLFGEQYRVVPRQHQDGGAEAQRRGARAKPGQQVEARRHLAEAGEVVLDDKGRVEAERLGLDIVVDKVAEPLAAVELGRLGWTGAPRCRAAEQTKPHLRAPAPLKRLRESRRRGAMFKMPVSYRRHSGSAYAIAMISTAM